ncbi:hypothetical protein RA307_19855 [Xanthobacteraceae bacterium Astr-EGSB]|uniref:hypothetical protein n=1 Tax=Astrobacterium formosum TaxID=3069710 RepID=UPI0027AFADB5|nr:hypothetical protein [Xanthobacteraceae bacterium Astr-EGSB]
MAATGHYRFGERFGQEAVMKMPRRSSLLQLQPLLFPPSKPSRDIFGLPYLTLLAQAGESEKERRQRVAKVEKGVAAAFKAAVSHLGEENARELFARVTRRPKRGRGKALAADRDYCLLAAYDEAVQRGETVASLARRLRASGIELGNTVAAIAAQIRKLVKEREKQKRASAAQARFTRMALRNEPPTLLGGALRKK